MNNIRRYARMLKKLKEEWQSTNNKKTFEKWLNDTYAVVLYEDENFYRIANIEFKENNESFLLLKYS